MVSRSAFIINRYPGIIRNRGQFASRIGQTMRNLASTNTATARVDVAQATPRSFGMLASSTKNRVIYDLPSETTIGLVYQDATRGGYPYAAALRRGVRPGTRIPYRNLIPWVVRNIPTRRPQRVAFFIAEALAREGRIGYDYAKGPTQALRQRIGPQARTALVTQVKSLVR